MQLIQAFRVLSVATLLTVGFGRIPEGEKGDLGGVPHIESENQDLANVNDTMGPLFATALRENSISSPGTTAVGAAAAKFSFKCVVKCAKVVVKAGGCAVIAIATGDPSKLLHCGIGKKDTCACVDCFPGRIRDWINKHFCNSNAKSIDGKASVEDEAPQNDLEKVTISANPDINVRVALGLATGDEIRRATSAGYCVGKPCGSDKCCLGLCADDSCIGTIITPAA